MSNQQGLFYPQDQQPDESADRSNATYNAPPEPFVAQQHASEPISNIYSEPEHASYREGYTGTNPSYSGEKLRPRQQSSKLKRQQTVFLVFVFFCFCVVIFFPHVGITYKIISSVVASVIVGALFLFLLFRYKVFSSTSIPTQIVPVQEHARLVIKNSSGSIKIKRGAADAIKIDSRLVVKNLFSRPIASQVDVRLEDNQVFVAIPQAAWRWAGSWIDLEIAVPAGCDVQFEGNFGTIDIDELDGEIIAKTNAGTINVRRSILRGHSSLKTNGGTIDFTGTLDARTVCGMESNMGTIKAIIASDASFMLDAKTNLGTMNNQFGSNIVGTPPYARLDLHSNLGTIDILRG